MRRRERSGWREWKELECTGRDWKGGEDRVKYLNRGQQTGEKRDNRGKNGKKNWISGEIRDRREAAEYKEKLNDMEKNKKGLRWSVFDEILKERKRTN